jgi:tetratricopeptide (TPR) repeat protein
MSAGTANGWRSDAPTAAAAAVLLLTAFGVGNGLLAPRTEPVVAEAPAGLTVAQQERIEKVASASLFGQFRSSTADFLYLKVDKYLHKGIEMRGLTPEEQKSGQADAVKTAGSDLQQGFKQHEGETTVVPSAARDWRGFVGDMEREIEPYRDMGDHTHASPKETLPLFRLMTWSNPHFIPGYTVGSSLMVRTQPQKALSFLEEGEKNNPRSIEVKAALGEMLASHFKRRDDALPKFRDAVALARERDFGTLTEDEKDAYETAYRLLIIVLRDAGRHSEAEQAARECLTAFPGDGTATRYLKSRGIKPEK